MPIFQSPPLFTKQRNNLVLHINNYNKQEKQQQGRPQHTRISHYSTKGNKNTTIISSRKEYNNYFHLGINWMTKTITNLQGTQGKTI